MSLYKQLWLAIILLMTLAFGGSFWVSNLSAKSYLEEQLYLKNLDNVNALALSISSQGDGELAAELQIAAQFDAGHYRYIRLHDPDGELLIEREDNTELNEAPAWFMAWLPVDSSPASAQVSNGWQQLGTLTLASHTDFAYNELWHSSQRLMWYFAGMALLAGLLGSLLLKLITRPLGTTVAHAEAIGERRFISSDEPYTLEFKAVTRAMNKLSERVKKMLSEESAKLAQWRKDTQVDKTTGLLNREPMLAKLHGLLQEGEDATNGSVVLVRLLHLAELNRSEGRAVMDALLNHVGRAFTELCTQHTGAVAGRLNGSDFIFVSPELSSPNAPAQVLQAGLLGRARELGLETVTELPTATTLYRPGESVSGLLTRVDGALASSERNDSFCTHIACGEESGQASDRDWAATLAEALANQRFTLTQFPVRNAKGEVVHMEAPVRLLTEGNQQLPAGQFMPHINRLNLGGQLDLMVTKLALQKLPQQRQPIGINLSAQLLSEPDTMAKLAALINEQPQLASRLWLEVPESGAYRQLDGFRTLCQLLKPLGCQLGIEHIGPEVGRIGELHDLGLDYVKIDRALIHQIDRTTANQVFLRGLCTIVHSIGLLAIAEGVETEAEWTTLAGLGLDAGTGRHFS